MAQVEEHIIGGKVYFMREMLKVLKDKGDGKAGLGFNEASLVFMDSPEDGVFRVRGKPGKGRAPYVRVVLVGMNVAKGAFPSFNPTWLYRFIKTGNVDDNFSMIINGREKAVISFTSAGVDGFSVPLGKSKEFEIATFEKHKLFNEDLRMNCFCMKYDLSMASFKLNLERASIIHDKFFAFYSIDGRLYMYVRSKGADYFEPVGTVNSQVVKGGEIVTDKAPFDTYMPVSTEFFKTIVERFDSIEISLPQSPDKIKTFVIDATVLMERSSMEITLASGRNNEFENCPTIEEIKERIATGEFGGDA